MPNKVLILFAHPSLHHSRINKAMIDAVQGLDHVTVHDLYETYPEFYINVQHEQALLKTADLIVFHHPIHWYSAPPMIKLWQDVVLERGFAYDEGGDAIRDKDFMLALSTGGKEEAYQREGNNHFTLEELLYPYQAMSYRCGLRYHKPFLIHGSYHRLDENIQVYAMHYRQLLNNYVIQGVAALQDEKY